MPPAHASHRAALLLGLVTLSTRGLSYSRGNLNEVGILAYVLVLAGLAVLLFRRGPWSGSSDTVGGFPTWQVALPWVTFYLFATSAGRHLLIFAPEVTRVELSQITLAAAVLAVPLIVLPLPAVRRRLQPAARTGLVLLPFLPAAALFLLVPSASPLARIDVYHFQAQAAQALLHGLNPYAVTFRNTFGGAELYPGGVPDSYPYPPLSFLFALVGHALGDVRWPLIASHFAAAGLLWATARARGLPADEAIILAGLFFYLPHAPFVSEQAWTDPSVALGLGIFSLLLARRQPRAALWAAGFTLALKQTMVLLLPPLWALWRRLDRRAWTALLAIAVVTYGGFLLWNPAALWHDVVAFHLATPFRANALTLSAFHTWMGGHPLPAWLSLVGLAGGWYGAVYALRRTGGQGPCAAGRVCLFFAGLAFADLLTLLLSKHAFMNYYYLLQYLLVTALVWARIADTEAVAASESGNAPATAPTPPPGAGRKAQAP